jgi:hypothetical protein
MKNSRFCVALLLVLLAWTSAASSVFAVGARLRILLPVSGSAEVQGFGDEAPETGEFGLSLLVPVADDTRLIAGYAYFSAAVEERLDNTTTVRVNEGRFDAHLLEVGAEYGGWQAFEDYEVRLSFALKLPLGASGKVETTDVASSSVTQAEESASGVSGGGVFASVGLGRGRWEGILYYQGSTLDYGLDVPQQNGATDAAVIQLTEVGVGVGYVF